MTDKKEQPKQWVMEDTRDSIVKALNPIIETYGFDAVLLLLEGVSLEMQSLKNRNTLVRVETKAKANKPEAQEEETEEEAGA